MALVRLAGFQKLAEKPLYVRRNVTNADEIIAWAKGAGFPKAVPPEEMHVTIAHSYDALDWSAAGDHFDTMINEGGARSIQRLGDKGAVVLMIEDKELSDRWQAFKDAGASWDYPGYQPHVTITYQGHDVDLSGIEPYDGPIIFGPEIYETLTDGWADKLVEKRAVCKVDHKLGLVFGWGIVCKIDGEEYFDFQGDHIPEDAMVKATSDFMVNSRIAKEMHVGDAKGQIVHSFPLSADIAKAMGITTRQTGWMVAMKPDNPDILWKFANGDYTGFSIGGDRIEDVAA